MNKFKKYLPWLIAGGAIAIAVGTRRFYASKLLLEIPTFSINGGELQAVLPSIERPLQYVMKNGDTFIVYALDAAETAVKAAA